MRIASDLKRGILKRVSRLLSRVDDESKIHPTVRINRFVTIADCHIDRYTYLGPRTKSYYSDIGSFCSISWDCHIGLSSHGMTSVSTSPIFETAVNGTGASWVSNSEGHDAPSRTKIGHDVWIGARAIILEGVTIGSGAVVAAGAIVTRDVAPYAVVAGVPAKHVKYRFSPEVIAELLECRWWLASEKDIRNSIEIFQKRNIDVSDIRKLPSGQQER